MSGTVLDLVNAGVTRIVMPSEKAALPPVRSEPMLAPEHLRVWQDIVDMCKRGGWSSINVASKQRMAAIIAVDEALRANVPVSGGAPSAQVACSACFGRGFTYGPTNAYPITEAQEEPETLDCPVCRGTGKKPNAHALVEELSDDSVQVDVGVK